MKFSDNLKLFRKTENICQKTLAEKLNVSIKTVSHWETGYTEPSIAQLIAIAEFFDVTVDDLIGRNT